MKREDIEKAAKEEADKLSCLVYYGGSAIEQEDIEYTFVKGVYWRINSVWHDASQEPTEKKIIVVINSEDVISQISFLVGADNWNDCVKKADIVKWCYKEDLLPTKDD